MVGPWQWFPGGDEGKGGGGVVYCEQMGFEMKRGKTLMVRGLLCSKKVNSCSEREIRVSDDDDACYALGL